MIDPSRFKSGQLLDIFIIHHKVSIRVNKAGGIQPQYYLSLIHILLSDFKVEASTN